jgi:hypothetical protein
LLGICLGLLDRLSLLLDRSTRLFETNLRVARIESNEYAPLRHVAPDVEVHFRRSFQQRPGATSVCASLVRLPVASI